MGTESDPRAEEQAQVYTFHQLLLLEFTAAKYVATLDKVSDIPKTKYYSNCIYINVFWAKLLQFTLEIVL